MSAQDSSSGLCTGGVGSSRAGTSAFPRRAHRDGLTHPLRCLPWASCNWLDRSHVWGRLADQKFAPLRNTLQTTKRRPISEVPSAEVLKVLTANLLALRACEPLTHNIPNWECCKCSDVPKNCRCQLLVHFWLREDFSDPLQRNINHIYKSKDMSSLICQATVIYRHLRILTFQSMSSDASAPS